LFSVGDLSFMPQLGLRHISRGFIGGHLFGKGMDAKPDGGLVHGPELGVLISETFGVARHQAGFRKTRCTARNPDFSGISAQNQMLCLMPSTRLVAQRFR
jgi:hypothetical protein